MARAKKGSSLIGDTNAITRKKKKNPMGDSIIWQNAPPKEEVDALNKIGEQLIEWSQKTNECQLIFFFSENRLSYWSFKKLYNPEHEEFSPEFASYIAIAKSNLARRFHANMQGEYKDRFDAKYAHEMLGVLDPEYRAWQIERVSQKIKANQEAQANNGTTIIQLSGVQHGQAKDNTEQL